ncbi:MAG TPA: hypothetical protein VFM68_01865 [Candidatus Saccharimonadales bacterium]|nr:hypothetical protein [Candidatus Saccharimonadales bacterium]
MNKLKKLLYSARPWQIVIVSAAIIFSVALVVLVIRDGTESRSLLPSSETTVAAPTLKEGPTTEQIASTKNQTTEVKSNPIPFHRLNQQQPPATTDDHIDSSSPASPKNTQKPLASITITGGNNALVAYKTNGLSSAGYLITWRQLDKPSMPSSQSAGVSKYELQPDVHSGNGLLSHLRFASGKYEVRICQNKNGTCGIQSNPIYLTVKMLRNCPDGPGALCLITGSKMNYSF